MLGTIIGAIAEAYYGLPDKIKNEVLKYLDNDLIKLYNYFNQVIN